MKARPLYEIAAEIKKLWGSKISPYAKPYLSAMAELESIDDFYIMESGEMMVRYFLANAQGWRGDDARRIKKELNDILKRK